MSTLAPNTTFGKYRIIRLLGQGGMADVYEAEDERISRRVALKLLPESFARDEERQQRFEKEIRASAALDHPNIVSVFDVGDVDGLTYYTMSLLPGGDLKSRIEKGSLSPTETIQVVGEVSVALDFAHRQGFIHRDVKPENILFSDDGRVVLTDFGIARAVGSDTRMTAAGLSIGTPHYMSPEQARGQELDGRADLYALGVVLYECLTGMTPYEAQDSFAIGMRHINDPVPELPRNVGAFQPVLDRLMSKTPEDRFQTGREVKEALDGLVSVDTFSNGQKGGTRVMPSQAAHPSGGSFAVDWEGAGKRKIHPAFAWTIGGALLAGAFIFGLTQVLNGTGTNRSIAGGGGSTVSSPPAGESSGVPSGVRPGIDLDPEPHPKERAAAVQLCSLRSAVKDGLQQSLDDDEPLGSLRVLSDLDHDRFVACQYAGADLKVLTKTRHQLQRELDETIQMQVALDRALDTAKTDIERLGALARLSDMTGDVETQQQAEQTLIDAQSSVKRISERKKLVDDYVSKLQEGVELLIMVGVG